ncbi:MAG: hypothetical protein J5951_03155, partial [Bacteroidales bacterium]|nr:hypothetical protein [Bacteroidales bacterium]
VPGRIDDPRSQGCNQLLREQVAAPVTDPAALPAALGLGRLRRRRTADLAEAVRRRFAQALPPAEVERLVTVASLVRARRGILFDEICRETALGYAEVTRAAGLLEEEGFICVDLLQRCSINTKNV